MATQYSDAQLVDEHGESVGKVQDVIPDPRSGAPAWMVVKLGLLRGDHYVPVEGSYRSNGDALVVPYAADHIKSAPKAKSDHLISPELEGRLVEHYGLTAV